MQRQAVDLPALCTLELSDDDIVMYTHTDEVCFELKPYRGISVCRQLYERLFGGRDRYSYDGFLNQIKISSKLRGRRHVYTIRANDVKPDDFEPGVHNPGVVWDPSSSWSRVLYTIDDVSNKFNDLADLKAVCALPAALCDQAYPLALLPENIRHNVQNLGYVSLDIHQDGSVHVLGSRLKMPLLEKPMAVMHITMENLADGRIHSNVLLFVRDKTGKYTIDRFESHGSDVGTNQRPNALQIRCNFNAFYDSGAMDRLVNEIAQGYDARYLNPLPEFPVMGQSISNQSGIFNKSAPVGGELLGFRRKNAHREMGDPFCAAYTAYYMVLRLANPQMDRAAIYSYLYGPEELSEAQRGGRASDNVSHFILWAHNKFQTTLNSEAFIKALEQL
jgi:hypothetical protein